MDTVSLGTLVCAQCLAREQRESYAYVVFDGWSVCKEHFAEMDNAIRKLKEKQESKIIKPGG